MEAWAPVLVAIVTVAGAAFGNVLGRSGAKSQFDALKSVREALARENEPSVREHLRATELHIAKRIELRFRRSETSQSLLYVTFLYSAIWSLGWSVVYALLTLQSGTNSGASGVAQLALWYLCGGVAVLVSTAGISIAIQKGVTKRIASGEWVGSQNASVAPAPTTTLMATSPSPQVVQGGPAEA